MSDSSSDGVLEKYLLTSSASTVKGLSDSSKENVSSAFIPVNAPFSDKSNNKNNDELPSSSLINKETTNTFDGKALKEKDQCKIEINDDKLIPKSKHVFEPMLEYASTSKEVNEGFGDKETSSSMYPKFSKTFNFAENSYLQIIEQHIKKCVLQFIPAFLIKYILKVKPYYILDKLRSDSLYELNGLVFHSVKCRGTVIGFSQSNLKFTITDGTGSVDCVLREELMKDTENIPIIENFDTDQVMYQKGNTISDIVRGGTVQVLGCLDIYKNKTCLLVKGWCKEDKVVIAREIAYLKHLEDLKKNYCEWEKKVANILATF